MQRPAEFFRPLALDEQIASHRLRFLAVAGAIAYFVAVLFLAPLSDIPLAPAPAFIGIYGASLAVTEGSTALLLFGAASVSRSVVFLVLGSAYLFSALLAVIHVAVFPDAVLPDRSLLGDPTTVGTLFLLWKLGFPVLATVAVLLRIRGNPPLISPGQSIAICTGGVVLACAAATVLLTYHSADLPPAVVAGTFFPHSTLLLSWFALGLHLAGMSVAVIASRGRNSLYIWLALALLGWSGELFLTTASGARFTLGWYTGRASGVMAAFALFGLFLTRFARQNRELATALAGAEERAYALQAEVQMREQAEFHLLQSQKMEALGQLTGGIAHDFNNVLQVVTGQLHLLSSRLTEPRQLRYVTAIEGALARAGALTQHLRVFSRRRSTEPRMIDLARELPRIVELLRPSLRGDIELHWEVAPDIWPVAADPVELDLALLNLSLNARDAMPQGGRLSILAGNMRLAADAVPSLPGGPYVTIAISDTGVGIAPEILPRVFEPFFTTKPAHRGTGLGLSQVYSFAVQCGGSAVVESELSRGTTLTLHLPQASAREEAAEDSLPVEQSSALGANILVVEDNDPVADVVRSMLEELGCTIVRAATAQEALEILEAADTSPSLLLSDIVMPGGMNGVELARIVRERWPYLPILLTTGYSVAGQEARADGFEILPKPYRSNELQRAVATALEP